MTKLTWDSFPFNFSRLRHDLKFQVMDGDGNIREFPAHQFLLAGISKKFSEDFYDPTQQVTCCPYRLSVTPPESVS